MSEQTSEESPVRETRLERIERKRRERLTQLTPGQLRTLRARADRSQGKYERWAEEMREEGYVVLAPATIKTLALVADATEARVFLTKLLAGEIG